MDQENTQKRFESVYSTKVRAGKRRTYFFDVRKTKGEDFYITLTESTKRFNSDGYERHKIFLYKEDFNRFLAGLTEAIDHVKDELMPDYDYDEFTRRQDEWKEKEAQNGEESPVINDSEVYQSDKASENGAPITEPTEEPESTPISEEGEDDDMSW